MPQSNNQTSPRLGVTFFLVEQSRRFVARVGGYVIIQRTGVIRRKSSQNLPSDGLLFVGRQSLELCDQFFRNNTHAHRLLQSGEFVTAKDGCSGEARYVATSIQEAAGQAVKVGLREPTNGEIWPDYRMQNKMMKASIISLALVCFILGGCATQTQQSSTGRDFDDTKVSQIKKGVTKADDVVALYGEPDRKEIVSGTDVMWHYTYTSKVVKTHSAPFSSVKTTTSGFQKKLDVLLQNDVVINFTYVKTPIESENEFSAGLISN